MRECVSHSISTGFTSWIDTFRNAFRCARLNLVSLAYLWRREQAELLQEMIDCQLDAIIIKVKSLILIRLAVYTDLPSFAGRFAGFDARSAPGQVNQGHARSSGENAREIWGERLRRRRRVRDVHARLPALQEAHRYVSLLEMC